MLGRKTHSEVVGERERGQELGEAESAHADALPKAFCVIIWSQKHATDGGWMGGKRLGVILGSKVLTLSAAILLVIAGGVVALTRGDYPVSDATSSPTASQPEPFILQPPPQPVETSGDAPSVPPSRPKTKVLAGSFTAPPPAPASESQRRRSGNVQQPPPDPVASAIPISSTNVQGLANVPVRGAIGGQFRTVESPLGPRTYYYVTGVGGLTVIDATIPSVPIAVGSLPLPHWENEDVDIGGNTLLISTDGVPGWRVFVIDISVPTVPVLRGHFEFQTGPQTWGSRRPGHIATCIQDCNYAWVTGSGKGYIAVLDLTNPEEPELAASFISPAGDPNGLFTTGVVHEVNVDPAGIVWVTGSGGISAYSVGGGLGGTPTSPIHLVSHNASGLNDYILHNSIRPDAGNAVYVTEENLTTEDCSAQGRFQIWNYESGVLQPVSSWVLARNPDLYTDGTGPEWFWCSSHWFDYHDGLIAIGWYSQGVRFLDVNDPSQVAHVGWWLPPDAVSSAAYFHPDDPSIVYTADYSRGVDVIQICEEVCALGGGIGGAEAQSTSPIALRPSGVFGFACLVPARDESLNVK